LTGTDAPHASPALVDLDGWSIQPFTAAETPLLTALLDQRGHRFLLDVPLDDATLRSVLMELTKSPWSLPCAVVRDDEMAGFATTALPNVRALNTGFTALFIDPAGAVVPLSMYVRHLFWSFPLHRLHAQIPDLDLTREYIDLLTAVGFVVEGRLVDHAHIAGQSFDVVALGLLRSDFEAWTAAHDPRLSLT
jgi:hypothetical protein